MPNRVAKDEVGQHRLDKSDMTDSPARKSLRALKLSADQSKAVRQLLVSLAESEDIVEGFFQDSAELNPYTALMILEGYEQDGFYKLGTARALHKLLTSFVESNAPAVVRHDFATPVWDITPEKMARIRAKERMERIEAKSHKALELNVTSRLAKDENTPPPVKKPHCTIIQFPGLPKK
jgi:hypothetical protein